MFVQDAGRYDNLMYAALAAISMEMSGPASGYAKMLFFRSSTLGRSTTCIERWYDSHDEKQVQSVKATKRSGSPEETVKQEPQHDQGENDILPVAFVKERKN